MIFTAVVTISPRELGLPRKLGVVYIADLISFVLLKMHLRCLAVTLIVVKKTNLHFLSIKEVDGDLICWDTRLITLAGMTEKFGGTCITYTSEFRVS